MPSPTYRHKQRVTRRDPAAELRAGIDRDVYTSRLARAFAWTAQTLAAAGRRADAIEYLELAHQAEDR